MRFNKIRLSIFLTLLSSLMLQGTLQAKGKSKPESESEIIDFTRFERPICFIGKESNRLYQNVRILKEKQTTISRNKGDFRQNKKLEAQGKLVGSAKYLVNKKLKKMNFNAIEKEFGFFVLTLFGEARNLSEESIKMVAKVINNRKGDKRSYEETVTDLAQFSSWYYKNRFDNVAMLCPSKAQIKNWEKVYHVAISEFRNHDEFFKSKFYFAPHNMFPKHKIPNWSKGKHAIGHGGHIFIVSDDYVLRNSDQDVTYIPKDAKKIKIKDGKITLYN